VHPEPLGIALVVSAWNFPICKLCGIFVISL
jgi:acyl-CoA reductase-like NAD-dependent aldehyde dehydrogenase